MFFNRLTNYFVRGSQKVPLRLLLVLPFVLQIFAAVGLTGWLSFRNGQKAVNDLANQLMGEVAIRIEDRVGTFADTPHLFLQINDAAIRTGSLDLTDFSVLAEYFWLQTQLSEAVPYIYFGNQEGEFIGVRQEVDGTTTLRIRDNTTGPFREIYQLDRQGKKGDLISVKAYDPRPRPWYRDAVQAGKASWSSIYVFAAPPSLGITPVMPIYNDSNELQGVLATDLTLSEISEFLRNLKVTKSGHIFIIERSGEIVASSAVEPPFTKTETGEKQLQAIASSEPLIREAARDLLTRFDSFKQINSQQQFTFKFQNKRQFLKVVPIQDGRGLDWLMVVAIPEADFMEQIQANNRTTILLCIAALGIATLVGLITSRWIAQPILRLSEVSGAIASGQLNQDVEASLKSTATPVKELVVLANSFRQMTEQLRASFQQLEDYSRAQEQKVEQRTQELQQEISERALLDEKLQTSESKMRAFFEAMTDIVLVLDDQGSIEVAPTNPASLYDPDSDIIGLTIEQFFIDEKADTWLGHIRRALETKQTITFDYSLPVGNREVWFAARISPMSENSVIWVARDISDRKQTELALRIAQQKSEGLLLNILPKPIADQLKQDTNAIAEHFEEATILFSDIVGFTPLSAKMSPIDLVNLLNQMFSKFDRLADKNGLEKIKTIGDAYMVAGGLPIQRNDHAEAVAEMALEMQAVMKEFEADMNEPFQLRIGINTGPVVAGVIGIKKFIYDLWGDTVNVASRMESSGIPGNIQVSPTTYELLKDKFLLEERGAIAVKGKGEMITYWLIGQKGI